MDFSESYAPKELKFFNEIPELQLYNVDAVTFSEDMTMFNENFKAIGYIKSNIKKLEDCLLAVEVRSETYDDYVPPSCTLDLDSDDFSSTSSIMGFSTRLSMSALMNTCFGLLRERILTLEEQYDKKMESVRYLVKVGQTYYFDNKTNGELSDSPTKFSPSDLENVLTESVHLLLLKIMASNSYQGTFKAFTIDCKGNIRPCIYTAGPKCVKYFRKEKIVLTKVTRDVFFPNGTKARTSSILSANSARAVKIWWSDSNYSAAVDPKYFLKEWHRIDKPIPTEILESCPQIGDSFSKRVKKNMSDSKKYFEEHPEILEVLNKYLKQLLLRKPENILNFTLIFFSKLKQIVDKYP